MAPTAVEPRPAIAQPRVSQLIGALERRIGRQLFQRTSRRVTLNTFGEQLLAGVRPAFAGLRHAVAETRRAALGDTGNAVVGGGAAECREGCRIRAVRCPHRRRG